MKNGATDLIKFQKLQTRLNVRHWGAVGLLESLWLMVCRNCPSGDIGKLSNEDIAVSIGWDGSPDELIQHLVETKWLDADEEFRLVVHDWSEHAPNYVKANFWPSRGKTKKFADQVIKERKESGENTALGTTQGPPLGPTLGDTQGPPLGPHPRGGLGPPPPSLANSSEANSSEVTLHGAADAAGVSRLSEFETEVVSAWNSLGLHKCSKVTPGRQRVIKARFAESHWRANWLAGVEKVRGSPFCNGQGDRGWKADIDWFLKPDTLTKLLEGKFDERDTPARDAKVNAIQNMIGELQVFQDQGVPPIATTATRRLT